MFVPAIKRRGQSTVSTRREISAAVEINVVMLRIMASCIEQVIVAVMLR